MAITLTEKAASEVKRIVGEQQTNGAAPEKVYLRMRVVGGGCSGFQHKLDLDPVMNPKLDEILEYHGVPGEAYALRSSPDFHIWDYSQPKTALPDGSVTFETSTDFPSRYYQVVHP